MTIDEKKHVSHLEEQLNNIQRTSEETRVYLLSLLGRTNDEARMYRGLFWSLLGLAMLALTFRFLEH